MSLLETTLPYAALCTAMVLADVVTAWSLSVRVRRQYGSRAAQFGAGKVQSRRLGQIPVTLGKIYFLLLVSTAVDALLLQGTAVSALRFSTGAVCLWQGVSVLENEASCSNASWARIARRWLMDKAARHLK